jgi:hypothetical protein
MSISDLGTAQEQCFELRCSYFSYVEGSRRGAEREGAAPLETEDINAEGSSYT